MDFNTLTAIACVAAICNASAVRWITAGGEKDTAGITWPLTASQITKTTAFQRKLVQSFINMRNTTEFGVKTRPGGSQLQPLLKVSTKIPEERIMISYSWSNQKIALQLNKKLKNEGFDVWIDVEQMRGDMIEKMAEAVEGSTIIMILVSQQYKNSYNAHHEAIYAYQKRKYLIYLKVQEDYIPDGWLGFILSGKLYYEVYNSTLVDKEFPRIVTEIQDVFRNKRMA